MHHLCDLTDPDVVHDNWRQGRYNIIVADPPWWYADQRKVRKDGKTPTKGIDACHHYTQMKTEEIAAMEAPLAWANPKHCYLFMWVPCPLLYNDGRDVMEAWGFRYSTVAFAWIKMNPKRWEEAQKEAAQVSMWRRDWGYLEAFLNSLTFFGPGHHTGSNMEMVLLGIRGSAPSPAPGHKESQIIFSPRLEEHSRKPEEMQNRIERMYPFYPYSQMAELFARRDRHGWDCFGNECIFDPY